MLLRLFFGITAGLLLGMPAMAAPLHPAAPAAAPSLVLIKHDGHHDNGRHLGWYKRHNGDEDEDEHEDQGRRWSRRGFPGMQPSWGSGYGMPGYGSSYPPPAYGYPRAVYPPGY